MSSGFQTRPMQVSDVSGAVDLQASCFPPPFPAELLWQPSHFQRHLEVFAEGQFVVLAEGQVVASASSLVISEDNWASHSDWDSTAGGHTFERHVPQGTTLFGADISVHPAFRAQGLGRRLYQARFELVRKMGLKRFGTACRIPDWLEWHVAHRISDKWAYVEAVRQGETRDRTLTPLLRYGLTPLTVIEGHMDDAESGDAAVALEWLP